MAKSKETLSSISLQKSGFLTGFGGIRQMNLNRLLQLSIFLTIFLPVRLTVKHFLSFLPASQYSVGTITLPNYLFLCNS